MLHLDPTALRLFLNLTTISAVASIESALTAARCGSAAAFIALCARCIFARILAAAVAEGTGTVSGEGWVM